MSFVDVVTLALMLAAFSSPFWIGYLSRRIVSPGAAAEHRRLDAEQRAAEEAELLDTSPTEWVRQAERAILAAESYRIAQYGRHQDLTKFKEHP